MALRLKVKLCRCGIDPVTFKAGRCNMWRIEGPNGALIDARPTLSKACDIARDWIREWA